MMFVSSHGKENFVRDFAVDIGRIIGISYDERSTKFLGFHIVLFNQFPVNETGIGSAVNEGVFLDATFPLA